MNDNDYSDLLTLVRQETRRSGYGSLDDVIYMEIEEKVDRRLMLVAYLDMLTQIAKERSSNMVHDVVKSLSESIETQDGSPISNIDLVLSENDALKYDVERVSLFSLPDVSIFIRDIEAFRKMIINEPGPSTPQQGTDSND